MKYKKKKRLKKKKEVIQNGEIIVKKVGRPTKRTPDAVKKLVSAFKLGIDTQKALRIAKISDVTFYDWYNSDKDFRDNIDYAREYAIALSASIVNKDLKKNKNIDTAKWYLERKDPTFSTRSTNTTNINEQKILVIPQQLIDKHS